MASTYRCEVIAVNRGRASGNRTRWTLSMVVLVDGDAVFRRDSGPGHLQHIELRGYLKQGAGVLGQAMHLPDVAGDHARLETAHQATGGWPPLVKGLRRHQFKLSDAVAFPVDKGMQMPTLNFELGARFVVTALAKPS